MTTRTRRWTLGELHRLPDDDGNKYELVRGELFVTPAPTFEHETVLARLARILIPYVGDQRLGLVYSPRAVVQYKGSEVEPDLMVRAELTGKVAWKNAPVPILVVEALSDSTRRRDQGAKRKLYMDAGVAEYWIVDAEDRTITAVRPGHEDVVARKELTWSPTRASAPLTIRLRDVFG